MTFSCSSTSLANCLMLSCDSSLNDMYGGSIPPVNVPFPITCNFEVGFVVPMPTLPDNLYIVLIRYLLDVLITSAFDIFSLTSTLLLCKNFTTSYCDSTLYDFILSTMTPNLPL